MTIALTKMLHSIFSVPTKRCTTIDTVYRSGLYENEHCKCTLMRWGSATRGYSTLMWGSATSGYSTLMWGRAVCGFAECWVSTALLTIRHDWRALLTMTQHPDAELPLYLSRVSCPSLYFTQDCEMAKAEQLNKTICARDTHCQYYGGNLIAGQTQRDKGGQGRGVTWPLTDTTSLTLLHCW